MWEMFTRLILKCLKLSTYDITNAKLDQKGPEIVESNIWGKQFISHISF